MFTSERVPMKYDQMKIRRNKELEVAFVAMSLSVAITPELAHELGHNVLSSLFRASSLAGATDLNDQYEPNPDVKEVGFSFSVDPHIVEIFPVADHKVKAALTLAPVDFAKLKATRDESGVYLAFEASCECSDAKVLYRMVTLLGETVFLSFEPTQSRMDYEADNRQAATTH